MKKNNKNTNNPFVNFEPKPAYYEVTPQILDDYSNECFYENKHYKRIQSAFKNLAKK